MKPFPEDAWHSDHHGDVLGVTGVVSGIKATRDEPHSTQNEISKAKNQSLFSLFSTISFNY